MLRVADTIGHPGGPWSLTGPSPHLQALWMPQVSEGVSNGTHNACLQATESCPRCLVELRCLAHT